MIRGLTRHVLPLTRQVTVHMNDACHALKSEIFSVAFGAIKPVVLCLHWYSHVFSIDSLALTEQVVSIGGQTVSGTDSA